MTASVLFRAPTVLCCAQSTQALLVGSYDCGIGEQTVMSLRYLTEIPLHRHILLRPIFTPLKWGLERKGIASTRGHDCILVHLEPSAGNFPLTLWLGGGICLVAGLCFFCFPLFVFLLENKNVRRMVGCMAIFLSKKIPRHKKRLYQAGHL